MKRVLIATAFAAFLLVFAAGCKLSTPYVKDKGDGGYSDAHIQENIFRVSFRGDKDTPEEEAREMALLRAAEITLDNGYAYFFIAKDSSRIRKTGQESTTVSTSAKVDGYNGQKQNLALNFGDKEFEYAPKIVYTVKCFKEKPRDKRRTVYVAHEVKNNLGCIYIRTQKKIKARRKK